MTRAVEALLRLAVAAVTLLAVPAVVLTHWVGELGRWLVAPADDADQAEQAL